MYKCRQRYPKHLLIHLGQGYELSEEEVRISLDDFREKFGDDNGAPE